MTGPLVYSTITSLDGHVADRDGRFDWAAPDEEVHAAVNDVVRPAGTHLYGRRMYEVLTAWETLGGDGDPAVIRDFGGIWRAAEKVVYSRTLPAVTTGRTRLERRFDPVAVAALKESTPGGLTIGGPALAAAALRAGLVDELQLFVVPVAVGGGVRALPDDVRLDLRLLGERRFSSGTVQLRYAVR